MAVAGAAEVAEEATAGCKRFLFLSTLLLSMHVKLALSLTHTNQLSLSLFLLAGKRTVAPMPRNETCGKLQVAENQKQNHSNCKRQRNK